MRLIPLFFYEADSWDARQGPSSGSLARTGVASTQSLGEGANRLSEYSILSLRVSPCRSLAACACTDGVLRLLAVPDAALQHPAVPDLAEALATKRSLPAVSEDKEASAGEKEGRCSAEHSPPEAAVPSLRSSSPWLARLKVQTAASSQSSASPLTCVAWEPRPEPPLRFDQDGRPRSYALSLIATTGAGALVEWQVVASPASETSSSGDSRLGGPAARTNLSSGKGADAEAQNKAAAAALEQRRNSGRGIISFTGDQPLAQVRRSKKPAGEETSLQGKGPNADASAAGGRAAPRVSFSVTQQWTETIPDEQLLCCSYSARGEFFAAAGRARTIYVFDNASKTLLFQMNKAAPENPLLASSPLGGVREGAAAVGSLLPSTQTPAAAALATTAGKHGGEDKAFAASGKNPAAAASQQANRTGGRAPQAGGAQSKASSSLPNNNNPTAATTGGTAAGGVGNSQPQTQVRQGATLGVSSAAKPSNGGAAGAGDYLAHGNRIVQVAFLLPESSGEPSSKASVKSSKKVPPLKLAAKQLLVSCGVDNTLQLWSADRQRAVSGTAECSPLGEGLAILSRNAALAASHRDEKQLLLLRLPSLEPVQTLDINAACSCGASSPNGIPPLPNAAAFPPPPSFFDGDAPTGTAKPAVDEGALTSQFFCCRTAQLAEGLVAACGGGNRSQLRVYFIPQAFLSGSAGNAAGTTSSSACPCVRQAFHMFGLEALPLPPLSLDVCVANPPAPPPKKEKKPAAAAAVAGSEGNSGSAALASGAGAGGAGSTSSGSAGDGSLRQAFVSTITTKTSSRSQQPRETLQQAGPESAPEEETPLQPLVGGLVLAVVGARVAVFGVSAGTSDLSAEFIKVKQLQIQKKQEEAVEAATNARVLQAHAAAAVSDGAGETRKGNLVHDKDDDERVR